MGAPTSSPLPCRLVYCWAPPPLPLSLVDWFTFGRPHLFPSSPVSIGRHQAWRTSSNIWLSRARPASAPATTGAFSMQHVIKGAPCVAGRGHRRGWRGVQVQRRRPEALWFVLREAARRAMCCSRQQRAHMPLSTLFVLGPLRPPAAAKQCCWTPWTRCSTRCKRQAGPVRCSGCSSSWRPSKRRWVGGWVGGWTRGHGRKGHVVCVLLRCPEHLAAVLCVAPRPLDRAPHRLPACLPACPPCRASPCILRRQPS